VTAERQQQVPHRAFGPVRNDKAFFTQGGIECWAEYRRVAVATSTDILRERLGRYREVKISVIGRKSGRRISIPVWFVLEGDELHLLPVAGSKTQWYRNVLANPSMGIAARDAEGEFQASPVTGAKAVKSVVEKFREKYGAGDVKKYYSGFDVAVLVRLE
jgi:deazaflavin-dependent oxidoreductase (nitroreductase family)